MTIKPLIILPDPILRQVSQPLEAINEIFGRMRDNRIDGRVVMKIQ